MKLKIFRFLSISLLATGGFFIFGTNIKADTAGHLVISEIQIAGATANDEFVEIYNPTASAIDIGTWSIQYKGATGTTFYKKNFSSGASVPAHGWYLVANTAYAGSASPDMSHSTFSMSGTGGHIFLINNQTTLTSATDPSIIDKVGYGTADSPEGTAAPAPAVSQSIERKPGGDSGNGEDTDNNSADFNLLTTPDPRNTTSPPKPDLPAPICGNATCEVGEDPTSCPADCSAPPAEPGTGDVVINEFVADPAEGNEWIEFYNKKSFDINLAGWTVEDGVGTIATLSAAISANGFQTIELSSSRLNNPGDIIKLKKSDGTIIDQVAYGNWDDGNTSDNAPTTTDPNSVARKTDGQDSGNDAADFTATTTLTKNASNLITAPSPTGGGTPAPSVLPSPPSWPIGSLLINEFVADPADGENEWIEFYNSTNETINLENWTTEDGSETATTLSGSVGPHGFFVLEKPKGILNNAGDSISLIDPAGIIIDQVVYGDWDDGDKSDNAPAASDPNSVSRKTDGQDTNDDFNDFLATSPTKGFSNASGLAQTSTGAYSKNIIVNEALPNPKGDDGQNEFIELKNIGATDIDLFGWKLGDATAKTYTVKTSDFSSTIIKPGGFFVVYRKTSGVALNNSGTEEIKLYGPDNALISLVEYSGSVKEDCSYARSDAEYLWTSTPTPGKENVITRENQPPEAAISAPDEAEINQEIIFDGSDSTDPDGDDLIFSWNFGDGVEAGGSNAKHVYQLPGKFKITLTVKDPTGAAATASKFIEIADPDNLSASFPVDEQLLFINEVLPNPEGSDDGEWIELKSIALEPLNLSGWKIDDDEGGSRPYKIPDGTIINSGQFLIFKKDQTKLAFNNTSDAARLLDPNGEIFFETSYDDVPEGASWARNDSGNFEWTTKLTPGEENIFQFQEKTAAKKSTSSSTKKSSAKTVENTLEEIRNQDLGDGVKVSGQVIAEPGILGTQIFYIANEEACPGIQIYMYNKDFPELHLGDRAEITGVLSESGGEKRVKVSNQEDIKILEAGEAPAPVPIKLSEVEEGFEGCLVSASGEVTEKSGSNVYFADDDGELKIYFKSTLPFTKPNFKIGDQIETAGIISQTKTGFRLLPRYETDLNILPATTDSTANLTNSAGATGSGTDINLYLGAATGILGLTLVGLGLKSGTFGIWWKKFRGL